MRWTFFLVGNKFDTSGYIEDELESNKMHGEKFLVHKSGNAKVYVMKWSEVFTNFELRYEHLLNELQIERERNAQTFNNPDEVIRAIPENYARMQTDELNISTN